MGIVDLPTVLELPSVADFSLDSLARDLAVLDTPVDRSLAPEVIYYSAKKPLAAVKGWNRINTEKLHNMSLAALLQQLRVDRFRRQLDNAEKRCAAHTWHQFSAPNGSETLAAVRAALRNASLIPKLVAATAPNLSLHSENVWVGGGDVSSFNHYDSSYNAFVQIVGTKRWLLTSPQIAERLEPHSFLHPHFRRTQRHPDELMNAIDTGAGGTSNSEGTSGGWLAPPGVREIMLHAGQVLLLPPFLFHHVTATSDVSLAYNGERTAATLPTFSPSHTAPC